MIVEDRCASPTRLHRRGICRGHHALLGDDVGRLDLGTLLAADGSRVVAHAEEMLLQTGETLPGAVVLDVGLVGPPAEPRRDGVVVDADMAWFGGRQPGEDGRAGGAGA